MQKQMPIQEQVALAALQAIRVIIQATTIIEITNKTIELQDKTTEVMTELM